MNIGRVMSMMIFPIILTVVMITDIGTSRAAAGDVFKMTVPLPLSGEKKIFGEINRNSMVLAVEEFNEAGGFMKGILKGKKLEFVFEDTGGRKENVEKITRRLIIDEKVPLLTGFYGSTNSWAAAQIAAEYGVPFLVQAGSADKITQQGWENIFRMLPSASQYPSALADFLLKVVRPEKMAILYEPTAYGKSLSAVMRKFCAGNDIEVVYDRAYEGKQTDFRPMLLEVRQQHPDVIFMISYLVDAVLLMKQAKELDINPGIFAGGGSGFVLPDFLKEAGNASEYLFTTSLWAPGVRYIGAREFAEKYRMRYGGATSYHGAKAHAAVLVLADALERTVSLSHEDLIAAFKKTDIMTVFGRVKFEDFDDFTNQSRISTLLMQVQDGKLVTVWPRNLAEKRYKYPIPKWSER